MEETVKLSLPSNGVFIECSVGDRARWGEDELKEEMRHFLCIFSWKDPSCPFRTDAQLRLKNIPTLMEWGTVRNN